MSIKTSAQVTPTVTPSRDMLDNPSARGTRMSAIAPASVIARRKICYQIQLCGRADVFATYSGNERISERLQVTVGPLNQRNTEDRETDPAAPVPCTPSAAFSQGSRAFTMQLELPPYPARPSAPTQQTQG